MCVEPTTALAGASLAIGAAQAIGKFGAGQEDASAALAYQAQQRQLAEYARNDQWNQIGKRQMQEVDAASAALFDNSIRGLKARDTAVVQGGEAGVSGNSVEAVARNFYREQGRIDSATERNLSMSLEQLQDEKRAAEAARVNRSTFTPVRSPSLMNLGLDIAGAGVNAFSIYKRASDPNKG